MAVPIKTSQFAEIYIIGVKNANNSNLSNDLLNNEENSLVSKDENTFDIDVEKVGLATNLRINENLGSRTRTVIGTPVPVFVPGFYDGSISMERATILLQSFKSGANLNPLLAFSSEMYNTQNVDVEALKKFKLPAEVAGMTLPGSALTGTDEIFYISSRQFNYNESHIPGFLFVILLKDKIINDASRNAGIYVAMLRDFSVSYSSENAIILESVTAIARPLSHTSWFQVLSHTFRTGAGFGYTYAEPNRPRS